MKIPVTTPEKITALLFACIIGSIVSLGFNFLVYSASNNAAIVIGKDTVPSIISSNHINALLADAHSNAMNAMVTKEKSGGKFWTLYRKDMQDLHSELYEISKDTLFSDVQLKSVLAVMSNLGQYEYTLGGSVSNGAQISADQFGEANRLMQQKLLPASAELNKVYSSYLDSVYNSYIKNINIAIVLMAVIALLFLIILLGTQYYLFKKTHRVFNIGLVLASILFIAITVYSASALSNVRSDLYSAKHDAFDSIESLWNARAGAYNANALESLYLLHDGTGIVQTADTINFNLSASRLCSDPTTAVNGGEFKGYLSDEINNITFEGERSAAESALDEWDKYVKIDKQIRSLEYDSKLDDAVALCVGESSGQSNYEFAQFDASLGKAIGINQTNFNSNMSLAYSTLKKFPYITLVFLVFIILSCLLGLKPRIEEYKA